jgi:methylmalonyl-CoA mutase
LFQEIERRGGMAEALTSGFVQEHIGATAARRDKALAQRRDVLVGTNMYADPKERPLERAPSLSGEARLAAAQQARAAERPSLALALTGLNSVEPGKRLPAAITAAEAAATIGEISGALSSSGEAPTATPLRIYRGAEPYEALRATAAKYAARHGAPPKAFLANMGPVSQHKARADFASGFLQVAGFEMITNYGFASPAEAAAAAAESGAPVVVICSTDDTYPELVPALASALKSAGSNAVLVLAGYPTEHVETLRAAGVEEFVHLRADALETLGRLLARIS